MLLRSAAAVLSLVALVVGAAGCSPGSSKTGNTSASTSGNPAVSTAPDGCDKPRLSLLTPGAFTVATGDPAREPWFSGNAPGNGKGYESAVAYAVAERLGFQASEVRWVTAPPAGLVAPGRKNFDVGIDQVQVSAEGTKAVDFSTGYYDVAQSVLTYPGSPIAAATSLAGLTGATLGAQAGTTSYITITTTIRPSRKPSVFATNDLAARALRNKQIDGLVVDLPTGFDLSAGQPGLTLVGQISSGSSPEQFGFVLSKGSPLTPCVSGAVDALRGEGALARLQQQWLVSAGGAPELG
jgi:polar amino acid transport system substrate-binding protein